MEIMEVHQVRPGRRLYWYRYYLQKIKSQIKTITRSMLRASNNFMTFNFSKELNDGIYCVGAGVGFDLINTRQKLTRYSNEQQIDSGVNDLMIDDQGVYY